VLISGGGIAGSTLAYWLTRHGFTPTVVERAHDVRSSGSPVDVRGPAVAVAEQMGLLPQLREAATRVTRLTFVNGHGRRVGSLRMDTHHPGAIDRGVELARGDLAAILQQAARDDTEYLFSDTITTLNQDAGGVDITFERAGPRRFDLVVGADGLHSRVRRLVFGDESALVTYLGMYVATVSLERPADNECEVLTYNTPGKAVSIHPGRGQALAAFMFRRPEVLGFDPHDLAGHKRLLTDAFDGAAWRVPELLAHARETDDLYLDAVSQVSLLRWSTGRVTLLGDAASCVSLFGDGSSLAIAGAATLADALAASQEPQSALRRYETEHRTLTEPKHRAMTAASRLLVPRSGLGIHVRNIATRVSPIVAAAQHPTARQQDERSLSGSHTCTWDQRHPRSNC
jgi:2-polyprenyl-6-methoxyphenol hydroxylase-like FAD-dependent oxidoreductase